MKTIRIKDLQEAIQTNSRLLLEHSMGRYIGLIIEDSLNHWDNEEKATAFILAIWEKPLAILPNIPTGKQEFIINWRLCKSMELKLKVL